MHAKDIAEVLTYLLNQKLIQINGSEPFKLSSGIISPIYTSIKDVVGYPQIRRKIKLALANKVQEMGDFDLIMGIPMGGYGFGLLVADELDLPFSYIREETKKHGLQKQIQGLDDLKNKKIMVVDDVLTKGTTSTKSIRRIKEENPAKVDFCSVFSYEMKSMYDNFKEIGITPNSLIKMDLITLEILEDLFKPEDLEILLNFIKDPDNWTPKIINDSKEIEQPYGC